MDAVQALADLTEISSQVEQVAIVDADGSLLASTASDAVRAERFASAIARLLEEADSLAKSRGLADLTQLEISTLDGSVFVVRRDGRMVAATTRRDPTVGLIFYDLKHCLGSIELAGGDTVEPRALDAAPDRTPAAARAEARSSRRSSAHRVSVAETPVTETPVEETPVEETPVEGAPVDVAPADVAETTDLAPSVSEYTTFIAPRVEPPAAGKDAASAEVDPVDSASEPIVESATKSQRDEPTGRTPRKRADTSA